MGNHHGCRYLKITEHYKIVGFICHIANDTITILISEIIVISGKSNLNVRVFPRYCANLNPVP